MEVILEVKPEKACVFNGFGTTDYKKYGPQAARRAPSVP